LIIDIRSVLNINGRIGVREYEIEVSVAVTLSGELYRNRKE